MTNNHPFHMTEKSPWPLISSINIMSIVISMMFMMNMNKKIPLLISLMVLMMTMYQWWRDITRENSFEGKHTSKSIISMRWGMMLFITSEVMLFVSLFWAFLYSSLSPNIEIGMTWPPKMIKSFDPLQIPLLNTLILVSSSITATWAHNKMMENNKTQTSISLTITIILAIIFTLNQMIEYKNSPFNMSDSIYGSTFFMTTGFHGLHVMIGTTFILFMLIKHLKNHMSMKNHFGMEAAIWYWHFVDVVWLFLYMSMYWWNQ
uniref:Cytochrome c oxidase subunit 3 n=1 Tax=Iberobaenia minuta TaxID=1857294 RepID=A0A3G1DH94_9COLE|nr:cytochrome c oxidase subunit 3 [Iberobaenia minuta]